MLRSTGRLVAPLIIFALLLGTAWTGRASVARVDIDPALHAGDIALIQVAAGTAWTVAADLTAAGATEVITYDSVNVVSARLSDTALAAVATDRAVLRATTDAHVTAVGGGRNDGKDLDSFGTSSKKNSVGIDAIDAPSAWSLSTGAGVVVALMDSGIGAHPDLPSGKVLARVNFAAGNVGFDTAGHGTHLAGIIAGHGSTFRGVAPDARLVDIRVLDQNGDGTLHSVVAGFDWLLKNRRALTIRVLNLSLGTTQRSSYHQDLLAALAESAWFSGIAVVAAAGNDGPVPGTIATPGADPFIITAGSLDDQGTPTKQDDRESAFSSRGPTVDGFAKPDVLAPGRRVVSLRANGSQLELTNPERVVANTTAAANVNLNGNGNGSGNSNSTGNSNRSNANLYIRMSGTSVSSAMVSGVAALILSVHTDYTPTKTKGALVASGRSLTGSVSRAVTATTALTANPRAVNSLLLPSRLLMTTLENSGVVESGTTWEGVTWEGVTWEGVTWETVTWESITWESVSWEGVMWETVSWEQSPLLDRER